jgi:hypothetical protein
VSETSEAIDNLGAAIESAQNRSPGIETHGVSDGVNAGADKIGERWREAEAAYGAGFDAKEAAQRIKAKQAESAASGPTAEDVQAADAEQHRRVAERMGVEGVDLNTIRLTKDEPISARDAGKLLSQYHQQRAAELEQIVGEQAAEREWNAQAEQQQPEAPQVEQPETPQPDPLAVERWQMETERQALQALQQATEQELLLAAQIREASARHRAAFSDVTHESHIDRLSPERRAAFMASYQQMASAVSQLQGLTAQRQLNERNIADAQRAANHESLRRRAAETSKIIEAETPELKDPRQAAEFKAAAARTIARRPAPTCLSKQRSASILTSARCQSVGMARNPASHIRCEPYRSRLGNDATSMPA